MYIYIVMVALTSRYWQFVTRSNNAANIICMYITIKKSSKSCMLLLSLHHQNDFPFKPKWKK